MVGMSLLLEFFEDVVLQLDIGNLFLSLFAILIILAILGRTIRIVKEYERAAIFRLGRLVGIKGPGVVIVLPIIDSATIIDLRIVTLDVPKQNIITNDNVTVDVDAAVYFRVSDPEKAVLRVEDHVQATHTIAQTTLRDVVGQVELDHLLTHREELNKRLQDIIDQATEPWGVKATAVVIRDVVIPPSMQRAIAAQAEAERERRARVINAEGELQAAEKMAQAASRYAENPAAMRLRELQTWADIAREKNLIIVTEGKTSDLGTVLGVARGAAAEE